jgi:hypothetical protein
MIPASTTSPWRARGRKETPLLLSELGRIVCNWVETRVNIILRQISVRQSDKNPCCVTPFSQRGEAKE